MTKYHVHHYTTTGEDGTRFDSQIAAGIAERIGADIVRHVAQLNSHIMPAGEFHMNTRAQQPDRNLLHADVIVIENPDTEKFWIIDWQDPAHFTSQFGHSKNFAGATIGMYHGHWLANNVADFWKCRAGIYSSLHPDVPRYIGMNPRIPMKDRDDRLFFAGTIGDEIEYTNPDGVPRRAAVRILQRKHPDDVVVWDREQKRSREDWLEKARRHRLNLALAGHPHCSRENDLFCVEAPVIMPELLNNVSTSLRPNEHYVSVPTGERWGFGAAVDPEDLADNIWKTFSAVRHELDFLDVIADNARRYWYYEIDPDAAANTIVEQICWESLY